eukprot:PhF_6_TR35796/c0_g1_i1/m.52026
MQNTFALVLICISVLHIVSSEESSSTPSSSRATTRIVVGETLWTERIRKGQSIFYEVYNPQGEVLHQNSYECVISYTAKYPAVFNIELEPTLVHTSSHRRLLDTHKLMFSVDDQESSSSFILKVTMLDHAGTTLKEPQDYDVPYTIRVDQLYLGLPWRVWTLIVYALVCLVIGYAVFAPLLNKAIVSNLDKHL